MLQLRQAFRSTDKRRDLITIALSEASVMSNKQRQAKVRKVLREFKAGTLKSSSGEKITDRRRAIAIAMSEAGMSMAGKSDAYVDAYIDTMMCMEAEGPDEEGEEEEMDGSCGKKR